MQLDLFAAHDGVAECGDDVRRDRLTRSRPQRNTFCLGENFQIGLDTTGYVRVNHRLQLRRKRLQSRQRFGHSLRISRRAVLSAASSSAEIPMTLLNAPGRMRQRLSNS